MSLTASNSGLGLDDTIVALSSAPGPGRRAIVRLSGSETLAAVSAVFNPNDGTSLTQLPSRRLVLGSVRLTNVHCPLAATLYFFHGPKTYTGQDLAELHTISSPPLVEQLITDLLNAGARPARPGEFTMRAFLAGKKDLSQAEAVHAVIEAGTDADLKLALAQLAGGVTQPLTALREDLLNLLADLEAALDFSDEDIEFVGRSETLARLDTAVEQLTALQQQLDARTVSGRPVRIALVGPPNAGKTSLFNALVGSDALVSPIAGTTRDYLTRPIDLGGTTAELIDTAGWQAGEDTIAEQAQRLGREQATHADVIMWCVEAGGDFLESDAELLRTSPARVIRVRTKWDLLAPRSKEGPAVPVSVVSQYGLDRLRERLKETVVSLTRSPLAPSQSRCRHHVAASIEELRRARSQVEAGEPPELTAASLRFVIDQLGEVTGAVYTNDLLDRIFSRFCIGK